VVLIIRGKCHEELLVVLIIRGKCHEELLVLLGNGSGGGVCVS